MTPSRPTPTTTAGDRQVARAIGVAGLVLVSCWTVAGGVLVLGRVLLATVATPHVQDPLAPVVVSAAMVSLVLWLGSLGALGLGVAVSVAALVVVDRIRRAAAFFVLLALCAVTQYLLETLRSTITWQLRPDPVARTVVTVGVFVAPIAGLAITLLLLAPLLRRPRSTQDPAVAD